MALRLPSTYLGADEPMTSISHISDRERLLFFQRDGHRLFGVLHEAKSESRQPGVILCHAFAEEKLWAHRAFVAFARLLADRGFSVFRFDFFGQGDSDGDFGESTVESRVRDVHAAVEFFRAGPASPKSVSLMGLRFGASVAVQIANERTDIDRLILWEPIVDGNKYLQELLRVNLTTQLAVWREVRHDRACLIRQLEQGQSVNVDGYIISPELHRGLRETQLLAESHRFEGPCLILNIKRNATQKMGTVAEQLAERFPMAEVRSAVDQRFWQETPTFCPRAEESAQLSLEWLLEGAA